MKKLLFAMLCGTVFVGCASFQKDIGNRYGYKDGRNGNISPILTSYVDGRLKAQEDIRKEKIISEMVVEMLKVVK